MNDETTTEPLSAEEEAAAQQEAYYYYVIQEFYAICKVFGTKKVMEDLGKLRQHVEGTKDKPIILLP